MTESGVNSKAPFRELGFSWLVWSSLTIFTLLIVLFVRANSYFIADDYDHFIQAAHLPLLQLLSTPIDVHYVPLHKLFSALILQLAPLNFDLALGMMLAFHAASIVLLHRLLQALSESPANLLIVLLYACNPFLLHTLLWWSSGIHRFPYVLLCLASLYTYLLYRQARQSRYLAGCYLAFMLAFGFYSKAILIPFYILALELCLGGLKPGRLLQRFAPGAVMLLVSLGYVFWYLMAVPMQQGPTPSLLLVGEIVLSNFKVMAGVLTSHLYSASSLAVNVAVVLAMLTAILYSVSKERRTLWVWLVLFACVGISFAMVASSGRGQAYGQMLATVLRYYWDVMFLFALFGGLVLAMLRKRPQPQPQPQPAHWIALLFCVGYVGVLGWMGRVHFFELYENSHVATARYMKPVITGLDRLPAQRPLLLAQGRFPNYVYGMGFTDIRMPFGNILPLRYSHLVLVPQEQADYAIDEVTGAVLSLKAEGLRPQATPLAGPPRLAPGMGIDFKDDVALPGWHAAEAEHRWSAGKEASVVFHVQPDGAYQGRLALDFGSLGDQRVSLFLNGQPLGHFNFDASQSRFDLDFDPRQLNREGLNTLVFHLPDAQAPGSADPRVLAIALRRLTLY